MLDERPGLFRELANLPFTLALFSVHFYFVAYFIAIVQVPRSLEGEPDWVVGLVVGALGLAGMATRPLVGVLVDSGGRQRWLRAGAAGTAIAFVGYALSDSPWVMVGFRLLQGLSMGLFTTALIAMVTGLVPERSRGLGLGIYQSSNAVSQLYAGVLAVSLAALTSFEVVFFVGAGAAVAALVFGMFIADPAGRAPPVSRPWGQREWISRSGLEPAIVFLTMTTTMGAVTAFLPLFADERGLGNVGLFYSVYGLALLPTRSLAGALSDRVGRGPVVLPALALGSVALVLLSLSQSQVMLLLVAVVYAAGFGSVQVMAVALVADRTPPEMLGAGMATYSVAWDVGAVLGGSALGVFVNATSYAAGFVLCAALPPIGIVFYLSRLRGRAARTPARGARVPGAAGGDGATG